MSLLDPGEIYNGTVYTTIIVKRDEIDTIVSTFDRLCGLVVRVSGYRSRGPGFDSWPYQIF
jgi:hypothetical protein